MLRFLWPSWGPYYSLKGNVPHLMFLPVSSPNRSWHGKGIVGHNVLENVKQIILKDRTFEVDEQWNSFSGLIYGPPFLFLYHFLVLYLSLS